MRLVQVSVEHDNGKRNQEHSVAIMEGTLLQVASIVLPVHLRKRSHDAINLLGLTRKTEAAIGQKVPQPETKESAGEM